MSVWTDFYTSRRWPRHTLDSRPLRSRLPFTRPSPLHAQVAAAVHETQYRVAGEQPVEAVADAKATLSATSKPPGGTCQAE